MTERRLQLKIWARESFLLQQKDGTISIKTQEYNESLEATWLFSASVVKELQKEDIIEHLYCIKFEYLKQNRDYLEFPFGKVAGPLSNVDLIYHTKGDNPPCRLRTEYNGTHCHLRNEFYD